MAAAHETYYANASIALPAVGMIYTFTQGSLTSAVLMPGVKKLLQQGPYEVMFQSCVPSPYTP